MGDVININPASDPDVVLDSAKGQFSELLVVGFDIETGEVEAYGSTGLNKAELNFLIDMFKLRLLRGDYDV